MTRIKVLIVDDSALIRAVLTKGLSDDPEIEVVGSAVDPYVARNKIVELNPDVLTLDIEMPRMNGIDFLRKLMTHYPLPVVMVSTFTEKGKKKTIEALEAGAVDYVTKPGGNADMSSVIHELRQKIKVAAGANLFFFKQRSSRISSGSSPGTVTSAPFGGAAEKIIAIGASTGGTIAIRDIVAKLPSNTPAMLVVQHIAPGFTKIFAERLNEVGEMEAGEAQNGDRIVSGRIYVAPSEHQMTVRRTGGKYYIECVRGDLISEHRPSVDALFFSIAKSAAPDSMGVILTGTGKDGAEGLLAMRKAGARTIGQDEATSVVFGMPKTAFECGGAEKLVSLDQIAEEIMKISIQRPSR